MKEKLLIIGTGSLTGSKLYFQSQKYFDVRGSYNTRYPEHDDLKCQQLDITKYDKVREFITLNNPDYVINTAALNNVDYCEKFPKSSFEINFHAVTNLSQVCKDHKIKLIHLSTDSIFDGEKKSPYNENDTPNPINVYGQTKFLSEQEVLKNSKNLVIRASVLYGWLPKELASKQTSSLKPQNFAQWLITSLQKNEKIKIISDEYSSPILADDFASSILHLILKNQSGIFHSAPNLSISRFEFSIKLAKKLELNHELISSIKNNQLGRNVKTALNKSLNSKKLQLTGFTFLNLEESFELIKKQINY